MSILSVALKKTWSRKQSHEANAGPETPTEENIRDWLVSKLADALKVDPTEIDVRQTFANYGLGSLSAVRLAGDLETWLHREIPPTLTWDYPTIEQVVQFLSAEQPA